MSLEVATYLTTWQSQSEQVDGETVFQWRSTVSITYPWDESTQTGISKSTIATLPLPDIMPPDPNQSLFEIVADPGTHDLIEANEDLTELMGTRRAVSGG